MMVAVNKIIHYSSLKHPNSKIGGPTSLFYTLSDIDGFSQRVENVSNARLSMYVPTAICIVV